MALTGNTTISRQDGARSGVPVYQATSLYEGSLVFRNASGYAVGSTGSGANRLAGVAVGAVDNSGGSDGDLSVEVYRSGVFTLSGSGFAITDVGKRVYASDNNTVTLTAGGNVFVGRLVEFVSATSVRVELAMDGDHDQTIAAITATGSNQGDAAALTGEVNDVAAGDGTKGVILPANYPLGKPLVVYHSVATVALPVYPPTSGTINGGTANAAVNLEGKTVATFWRLSATNWAAAFTANS